MEWFPPCLWCLYVYVCVRSCVRAYSGKVQQLYRVERKLEELWKGLQHNNALVKDCDKEAAELREEKDSCLQRLSTIEQDIQGVSSRALCIHAYIGISCLVLCVWVWSPDPSAWVVSISGPVSTQLCVMSCPTSS